MNKQSSVIHIRNWVRTNGDMSEDGQSITYSCKELESIIAEAKAMHKEEIIEAHFEGQCDEREGYPLEIAEQYYNETYGGNNDQQ